MTSVPTLVVEQDQRVLEVDATAGAVLHHPLVEHLEEDLVHVRMGLLDLVEQDDAVGPAAHGLGEASALAVADIAGRRPFQGRDGVRLLELGHVDRNDVLFAAVERFGEGERCLGLADAGRPAKHENPDRLVGVVEPRAVGLDPLGDHLEPVGLADNAPVQDLGEVEHGLDLVGDHLPDRDARPVGDDRCDGLLVDMGVDHPLLRNDLAELADFGAQGLAVGGGGLDVGSSALRRLRRSFRRRGSSLRRHGGSAGGGAGGSAVCGDLLA